MSNKCDLCFGLSEKNIDEDELITLSCDHTFCETCLLEYYANLEDDPHDGLRAFPASSPIASSRDDAYVKCPITDCIVYWKPDEYFDLEPKKANINKKITDALNKNPLDKFNYLAKQQSNQNYKKDINIDKIFKNKSKIENFRKCETHSIPKDCCLYCAIPKILNKDRYCYACYQKIKCS